MTNSNDNWLIRATNWTKNEEDFPIPNAANVSLASSFDIALNEKMLDAVAKWIRDHGNEDVTIDVSDKQGKNGIRIELEKSHVED